MKKLLAALLLTGSLSSFANGTMDITSIKVEEVTGGVHKTISETELDYVTQKSLQKSMDIGKVIKVTRDLVALGKEVYKIIEDNKPVVNRTEAAPLSVLPKNENGQAVDGMDLENWRMPVTRAYKVTAESGLGFEAVSFTFKIMLIPGGSYNGKGAYITGAEIISTDIDVFWGYELNVNTKVQSISNQGSRVNPLASAMLQIEYSISTILKTTTSKHSYLLNGNGNIREY